VLLDFATETLKKHSSEDNRLTMVINRAQAYKWSGEEGIAKTILDDEDWTATSPKFRLARAVLLEEVSIAIDVMRQIGPGGEVEKHYYRDWPVFKEIRKTKEFGEAFESIFGEPLYPLTVETNDVQQAAKQMIQ
jgi:hypothetical protein